MRTRRKTRDARTHGISWVLIIILVSLCVVGYGGYRGVLALFDSWTDDLPDVNDADAFQLAEKTTILANDGSTVLAELYLENREPITIDKVSQYVLNGTVATEDERFYQHKGVDLQGIARAVAVNLTGGQEGASTITQQFVRNTLLSSEMNDITVKRKVREMELAIQLEKIYGKDEILMMYLNTINYGDGCYGIQSAAQHYYSVDASDLTLAQAATLVGIPNSPTLYNPVQNPDNALQRRNLVLSRMLTNGYITQDEYNDAAAEDLDLDVEEPSSSDGIYKYPWFTSYVRDTLEQQYSTDVVFKGGLTVTTTIDPQMQEYAEEAVENEYNSGTMLDGQEIALTCVDPHTGFIKAMIGGRDYSEDQFNIATSSKGRQTGSSFKMFTLATAINQGIDPNKTFIDCNGPVTVSGATIYNFGHHNYGTLSIADMTACSSNTGYIRLVTGKGGVAPQSIIDMATSMGLSGATLKPYPSITLGTGEANTTEMASAYGTLAANGVHHEATGIVKVVDRNGNVLVDNTNGTDGKQVISGNVAYAVTQVLEGVVYKSNGTAHAAALPSGQVVAGKTGTTDYWRDLWWCGYTPQLSCSVWVGSRDNTLIQYSSTWAQDVWRHFMTDALSDYPIEDFKKYDPPAYSSKFAGSSSDKKSDDTKTAEEKATDDSSKDTTETQTPAATDNPGTDNSNTTTTPTPTPNPGNDQPSPTPNPGGGETPSPDPGGGGGGGTEPGGGETPTTP
ncbi:transglycosylase domain-containing protein [Slackia exigua]|uniref:transglycosylase domain-containing protein n=1 Tax=Slackia exigua TaxID=84109 RepID=UPI003AB9A99E